MYIDMFVMFPLKMFQISCTYYSEVANSGSSAIPGHSYNFHVKLNKTLYTDHSLWAFLYMISKKYLKENIYRPPEKQN